MKTTPSRKPPFHVAEDRIHHAALRGASTLDLSNLGLEQMPPQLALCRKLQELNLSNNLLTTVPKFIGGLSKLCKINLNSNKLESIPDEIGNLPALTDLYCNNNRLTSFPESLSNCNRLVELRAASNALTRMPTSIPQIKSLKHLYISNNNIADISDLRELKNLVGLGLAGCSLLTLPEIFSDLQDIRILHLGDNLLTHLPSTLSFCKDLRVLVLENNRLVNIPRYLSALERLEEICLHNNPLLTIPADVLGPLFVDSNPDTRSNPADILNYYFNVRAGQARPLNEVKLLLVGRGKAGKSSLRDKLIFNTFDENKPETPGIDIQPWELHCHGQDFRIHVWDFAGQEITHATHQFFLTERSVYVLVLEGRSDNQDRDAEYWLRLISTFGKNSPIIIALNQWDERPFDVDRNFLLERYPAIKAFIPTDCKSELGIEELKQQICDILRDLKEVHEPFPGSWWSVKEHFGTSTHNYIQFTQFRELCEKCGLKDPHQLSSLARILHALGIILHYGEDARLKDTTVLNPQWVTTGVYRLLRLKDLGGQNTNGTLTITEATAALADEPEHMVRYLIELMRRFELCYALDDAETRWLIPQVLTRFQPKLSSDWITVPATRLRYTYKVIPEGLLPRFIVRTHPLSEGHERWRNGVVLEFNGALALIKADTLDNRISVTVQGPNDTRFQLVQLIRGHLQEIHASISGLNPKEEMEIADHPGTFKDVATLERDERRRAISTIETDVGSIAIDQTPLLDTISSSERRNSELPCIKAFLSYARQNHKHRDIFNQNLTILKMNGLVSTWHDRLIRGGEDWDHEIRRELDEADIIVLLVSTDFLASGYIRSVEMVRALQRHALGEVEILVLLLETDCDWKEDHQLRIRGTNEVITCNLSKFQVIHPKKALNHRWPAARGSFNHVQIELKAARERILARQKNLR